MEEFLIPSVTGSGGLLFYDRSPPDPDLPIGNFWVRVSDHNLSAAAGVYAGWAAFHPAGTDCGAHPAGLFAEMAKRWTGWSEPLAWDSLEGELALQCTHDGLGHIAIRVELRSGHMEDDWRVQATVIAEAGQLEAVARRAAVFFGRTL